MKFDSDTALEFLQLFKGSQWLQTFDDKKLGRSDLVDCDGGSEANIVDMLHLANLNRKEAGIYFCVNQLKPKANRSADNIELIRAFFVDLDGAPLQPVMEFKLPPSIVVQTSEDRWHGYWLLKEPIKADKKVFKDLQREIALTFNGDKAISDLCRVMRLPGFYNMKNEPFMVNWAAPVGAKGVIKYYSWEEVRDAFLFGKDISALGSGNIGLHDKRSGVLGNIGFDELLLQELVNDAGGGNAWDTDAVNAGLLRGALLAIAADEYDIWINIGIALKGAVYKGELEEEMAEEFWHKWSETSTEYDEVLAAAKWQGFNVTGEKSLGSIFFAAKELGWKGEPRNYWSSGDMLLKSAI